MPASVREAKARLSDMNVQEVSLVDKAANERVWALKKRDGRMGKMTKAEWTAKAKTIKAALSAAMQKLHGDKGAGVAKLDFKLPSEAKQSLMDALADALDKLTALATMVGDAEVDDQAPVPEELAAALTQVAEMLEGTASQYAAGAPTAEQTPPGDQQQAGGTGPAGAPPPGADVPSAGKRAEDETQKGLPSELHDGDALKTELHDGDSLKQLLQKALGVGHLTAANLSKAGRKMAAARYEKLKMLHEDLGKLLADLAFVEHAGDAGAAEKAKAPPPPPAGGKKPDEKAPPAPAKKGVDAPAEEAQPTMADLKKALDESVAEGRKAREALEQKVAEIGKRAGLPASALVEGGPPPAEEGDVQWPMDMSAHVAQKRAKPTAGKK